MPKSFDALIFNVLFKIKLCFYALKDNFFVITKYTKHKIRYETKLSVSL